MGENDVGIKGLCTGFRSLVRAVRRGALVRFEDITISSDCRCMGVTPGLDVCIAVWCNRVCIHPTTLGTFFKLKSILRHTFLTFFNDLSPKWLELKLWHIEFAKFKDPHDICFFLIIDNFPLELVRKMSAWVQIYHNSRIHMISVYFWWIRISH